MCNIRVATSTDIRSIAEIHQQAFNGFMLTLFGVKFLRLLYQGFLEIPEGLVFVASGAKGNLGFVAGAMRPEEFFGRLRRRRGISFALAAAPALLKHPKLVAERLVAALRYRGDALPAYPGYCLLSSLGVMPQEAGRGVGSDLVARFCDEARRRGAPGIYLTTDAEDNAPVRAFYVRSGFSVRAQVTRPNGRKMLLYVRDLHS